MVGLNQYMNHILGLANALVELLKELHAPEEQVATFFEQFVARAAYKQRRSTKSRDFAKDGGILQESLFYSCLRNLDLGISQLIVAEDGSTQIYWEDGRVESPAPMDYSSHNFEWYCEIIDATLNIILSQLDEGDDKENFFAKHFRMFMLRDYVASDGSERLIFSIKRTTKCMGYWAALRLARINMSRLRTTRIDICPRQKSFRVR